MTILLNGEPRDVNEALTVHGLLCELELERATVAVAVNSVFVPRSEHSSHGLHAGDRVEFVAPMQGG